MKHKALIEPKPFKTFRNKYLAVAMMVVALFVCTITSAQTDSTKYSQINGYGFKYKRHVQDSLSIIPLSSSPHTPYRAGGIRYKPSDSTLQLWTGYQWLSIITGVGNGIDTAYMVNDTILTIETPDQDYFLQVGKRHVDTLYKTNDSTLAFTINGAARSLILPGSIAKSSQTSNGDYTQDWAQHWLVINNLKNFKFSSDHPDATSTSNRMTFQLSFDSTVTGSPFKMEWVLRDVDDLNDSLKASISSTASFTNIYHHRDYGNQYGDISVSGLGVELTAVDGIKSSSVNVSKTITISPADSIRLKLASAATTAKIMGLRAEASGVWTPVAIDPLGITPSWQQTLNIGNTTSSTLYFDTTMVGNPVEKLWHKYEPLVKTDTATTAFYDWQFSGSNNGSFNEVRMFGWNLNAGGGQVIAGKPALGESWESNYQTNPAYPAASDRLVEKHEIYVTPGGTQHRLSSYTINTNAGTINYYHTVGNFSLYNVATHTPYYSILGTTNNTLQTWVNSTDQSSYFTVNSDFNQDANTSALTIGNGTAKPITNFNISNFTTASFPNAIFTGKGYDGTELLFKGATTGSLSRLLSDSSQFMLSTFTNVPMRFMPNTTQALDLRNNRVNVYQPLGVGLAVSTPIAQIDVRSAMDQTVYIENSKNGGYGAIISAGFGGSGGNVGLDVSVYGTSTNKGINFNTTMRDIDFNIFSNNASNTFINGKIGIRTQTPTQALHVNGQLQIDTVTNGTLGDSVLTIKNGLVQKVLGISILKGTTNWTPGVVAAGSSTSTTITVTGAVVGDPVTVSKKAGYSNGEVYDAAVTAPNTVTLRVHNVSTGSANYNTAEDYNVIVLKY